MGFRIAILFMVLIFPELAHAAVETFYFQGEMKIVAQSGSECNEKDHKKTSVYVDLALKIEKNETGEHYDGYYSGPDMQTGHFTGDNPAQLQIRYPDNIVSSTLGHTLALAINGTSLQGDMHEKHLAATDKGCNFDHAHLTLVRAESGEKSVAILTRLSKRFTSEVEFSQGYQQYDKGKIADSIPHLEAAVRLHEEIAGFASEGMIAPALYLSMAYYVTGRIDDGNRLQERLFAVPMGENKRRELLNAPLIDLYAEQAQRLNEEGKRNQAIDLIEQASARYPKLLELQEMLIEAYEQQGRVEEVCQRKEQAYSQHPEDTRLRETLGSCLAQLGDLLFDPDNPGKSLEILRRALELNPAGKGVLSTLLEAYSAIERPDEVLKILEAKETSLIRELGKKEYNLKLAYIYYEVASLAEKNVENPQAEKLYHKAVELNPDEIGYVIRLARFIQKSGRYQESVKFLNEQRRHCKDDGCRKTFDEYLQKEALVERIVKKLN